MPSDTEPPPPPSSRDSEPPPSSDPSRPKEGSSRRRRLDRLESVIPEIIKRAVEIGVEKARESPDNLKHFVGDMKLPKEIAHVLFNQIDETKNGLFRVVGKEVRDFLEHTNFAGEMQKLLTTVQFEVNTTIRFTPNDGRTKAKDKNRGNADTDEADLADDARDDEDDGPVSGEEEGQSTLPKPEVKTAVHVHRDRPRRRSKS